MREVLTNEANATIVFDASYWGIIKKVDDII